MFNRRENWIGELPAQVQAELHACAEERAYRSGSEISRAGEFSSGVHQILDGYAKSTGLGPSGETAIIVVYGPGNCWGESPIVAERRNHHTTIAMTDVRVRHIPRADFLRAFHAHPIVSVSLCRKFSKSMSRLIRHSEAQSADRMSRRVASCFYSFVPDRSRGPDTMACALDVPLTQGDIASFLGVTRQSIQPAVAALKSAGILEKRGRVWHVLDIARLRARATMPGGG